MRWGQRWGLPWGLAAYGSPIVYTVPAGSEVGFFSAISGQRGTQYDPAPKPQQTVVRAIIISLLTDRAAEDGDDLPYGTDRRGWWADAYEANPDDVVGSRLWLLERAPATAKTAEQARGYCIEALEWMTRTGFASEVDVQTRMSNTKRLEIEVRVTRREGDPILAVRWADLWGALAA